MFAVDEVIHHARLQRARTEQGHQGDHIVQGVGQQPLDQLLHAAGFELEHRRGFCPLEHLEGFAVVQGNGVDIERSLACCVTHLIHHLKCPIDDG